MDDKRMDDLVITVNRIADNVDHIKELSIRNAVMLDKNTIDVAEHIKRTNLLEAKVQTALFPIQLGKFIVAFLSFVGTICAILRYLGKI